MKKIHPFLSLMILCALAPVRADDKPATAAPAAPATAPAAPAAPPVKLPSQVPDVAAPKMDNKTGEPQAGFMQQHNNFVKIAKEGKTDLLFLGDSITAGWGGQKAIWEKEFGPYKPANFGIGGDRTQHVLWRIENGELDGIKPKAVMLMIGTNNGNDTVEATAKGVTKIVETIRKKLPETKILLLGIFPRGDKPENNGRVKNKAVNEIIAKLDDKKHVFFLDIGEKFLEPDGTLTKEVMPDLLHLSAKGYQIWADAVGPKLKELMK